jgi:hypothetical protein
MAAVNAERLTHAYDGQTVIYKWTLAPGDTATSVFTPVKADKTLTVEGTFGGATVTLRGTCNPSGATLDVLHDPFQNLLSFTARGTAAVMENTYQVAPALTGGVGSAVEVYLLVQGG